jgi:D-amino-acid dehydrogenase
LAFRSTPRYTGFQRNHSERSEAVLKVLVLGAGVVGVTTAWYLAKSGVEVEVVDRQEAAGLETSFANGGQISVSHNEPWANPAMLKKAFSWLGHEDAPMLMRWRRADPYLWRWVARFLLNCNYPAARLNADRIVRVALYSRSCLQALRREVELDYDLTAKGILHFFRDAREFDQAAAGIEATQRLGLNRRRLTAAEVVALEPALAAMGPSLLGGIYTPEDESGDALKFTQGLAAHAAAKGVAFRYGCKILNLEWDKGRISGVATSHGRLRADAYVLAAGSWSPLLARQVGVSLPVYPAKGYSATLPVIQPELAPTISLIDEEYKVVYSRFGDRLRTAGTAELAGWDLSISAVRARTVVERAKALFPGAADYSQADLWAGLRPVTPDSVPVLGATQVPNFFLNTGHGTLGWTMACGAGKAVADIVCGRPTDIDMTGLGLERFGSLIETLSDQCMKRAK